MEFDALSLAPLGAGDLIDRAVRLYRQHFMTLIGIAAPPVVVSAIGSTLFTIGVREVSNTPSEARVVLYIFMIFFGIVIVICGGLSSLIVMGGATRNLVAHLLSNERVSARATYTAVKSRFFGLLGASWLIAIWLFFAGMLALIGFYMVVLIMIFGAFAFAQVLPGWATAVLGGIGAIIATSVGLVLFFLLAGRVAYVPQAMLVEGRGVTSAIGRSFALASGNVRRLMAMTLFSSFATYSALMLLLIPLLWYGYLNGVNLSPTGSTTWPTWYSICYQVLVQISHILLAPIWMLGLSLLYVDERVRHEGYDIELMAARRLPEMPHLDGVVSPFAPALVTGRAPRMPIPPPAPMGPMQPSSVLGLQ
jgi:hypothetical protein